VQLLGICAAGHELLYGGIDAALGAPVDYNVDILSSERLGDRESYTGGRARDDREPVLLRGHMISGKRHVALGDPISAGSHKAAPDSDLASARAISFKPFEEKP
jgi:hypothetical protein